MNYKTYYLLIILVFPQIVFGNLSLPVFFIDNQGQYNNQEILYSSLNNALQIKKDEIQFSDIKLHFNHSNAQTIMEGREKQNSSISFIKGKDAEKWKSKIVCYQQIVFHDLYPQIDLIVTGLKENKIELQWLVNPGGNPNDISIQTNNNAFLSSYNEQESICSGNSELIISNLKAYQGSKEISIQAQINADHVLKYDVAKFDHNNKLIIDPVLSDISASGFFGGTADDDCQSIIEGRNGDIYIAGTTSSTGIFGNTVGYDTSANGYSDGYVACFNEDLTVLKYYTLIGGSNTDFVFNMAQNANGVVYVAGTTLSSDFPTTSNCYDNKCGNSGTCDYDGSFYYNDAVIFAFDETLSTLLYSTYLGGSKREYGYGISLTKTGNPIVIGWTESSNFPISSGAYDNSFNSGTDDTYITILDSSLSSINASTYIGGSAYDFGYFAYENTHAAIVAFSTTSSTNYPTTSNAYDKTQNGDYDIAVSVFSSNLSSLKASTFIGGSAKEKMYGAITDSKSNAIVAGYSASSNYPTSSGVVGSNFSGVNDQVLSVLDSTLSNIASTYIGGTGDDRAYDVRLDKEGNPVITGYTYSSDFPIKGNAYDSSYSAGEDAVIVNFHSLNLDTITTTYLGGTGDDEAQALLCHSNGDIYVVGTTNSTDFPVLNSYDQTTNGNHDVFVTRFGSLVTTIKQVQKSTLNNYSVNENALSFSIKEPAYIGYDIYTIDGKLIQQNSIGFVTEGNYNFQLPTSHNNIYILNLRMGEKIKSVKIF